MSNPTGPSPISGGSPTVYVSDMSRAVDFYTNSLGLNLLYNAGGHFAMVDAGAGFKIGLHPVGPKSPAPGTGGAIQIGLSVLEPIEQVVTTLQSRGVKFKDSGSGPVVNDAFVKLAHFEDPDGNPLYLVESPWKPS